MNTVASATGLTVAALDGTVILDRIDLELPAGATTALVGASGAGKTTLAHAFLGHLGIGLLRTAGAVEVTGRDPFDPAQRRRLRGRATAYLPQDPLSALDPRRTVRAQLHTAARTAHPREARTARDAKIREAARAAALEPELLRHRPAQLSGGQAQRVLLAWTLIARPRLIILDEPTSGLDADTAHRVGAAFTDLPWRPAVLLISHDRGLVARTADRRFTLTDGVLQAQARRPAARTAPAAPPRPRAERETGPVPAVEASGVTIRRGRRLLLEDASLTLAAADMIAVQGPSGSGKTSLARALCGHLRPETGRLRVHGSPVDWDAAVRARAAAPFLAYVGQDARAALNPHETARRTLDRAFAAADRHGRAGAWDAEALADRLGLPAAVLDRTPDRLSGGQRHRVALARALAAGPAALVCDETTAALDAATRRRLLDLLDHLRDLAGPPILLMTHQDDVAARADRVLTLTEGRLR